MKRFALKTIKKANPARPTKLEASSVRESAGRLAHRRGERWENDVAQECAIVRSQGRGVVVKLDPTSKTVGKGSARRIIYIAKGGADWIGVALGIPVAFETKAVSSANSYAIPAKSDHQLTYLREFDAVCAASNSPRLVGYYILWRKTNEVRFHHIGTIEGRSVKRTDGQYVSMWIEAIA